MTRTGRRSTRGCLVAYLEYAPTGQPPARPTTVGFVVGRTVGGAVVRNTVTRRLRALARERLDRLPSGSTLVVRALPTAATASSVRLAADLDACLDRLSTPAQARP